MTKNQYHSIYFLIFWIGFGGYSVTHKDLFAKVLTTFIAVASMLVHFYYDRKVDRDFEREEIRAKGNTHD